MTQNVVDFAELAKFQPKQQEAEHILLNTDCKYLLYGGAAAGGKSYFLRWIAVELGLYYAQKYGIRNIPIGLFSEDYPTLKDRQISRIKREMPHWLGELRESRDEGYVFQIAEQFGGARILLRNLDDPSKYASTEFAAICVEELTKNKKETFDDLRFRLRYPGIKDPKFVGATNPGSIGHGWVKKHWVDHIIPDDQEQALFRFVQAKVTDNKYIDPDYVKQLESLPEQKRKAFLDGSWDVFEGQVFTEFSHKDHVIAPMLPKRALPHYLWMDWGYSTKSAFACYASAVVPMKTEDGDDFHRVVTYQEWYGNSKSPTAWANIIYETARARRFEGGYCDPAMLGIQSDGSRSIAEAFEDAWKTTHGSYWLTLERSKNDRIKGVAMVHDWLSLAPDGLPYWLITNDCPNLIRTLPELVYDEHKQDDVNTKQEDHAFDACKYGLAQVRFISLEPGALPRKAVMNLPSTGAAELFDQKGTPTSLDLSLFARQPTKKARDWKYI